MIGNVNIRSFPKQQKNLLFHRIAKFISRRVFWKKNLKMRLGGFEPPTPALGEPRSIHLSYRRIKNYGGKVLEFN